MIKTILGLVISILKNKTYMAAAKEIWAIVDEKFRITEKVEDKLKSKSEEFNTLLLSKFPELTEEDVAYFRQSVAGNVNAGKEAVLSNSDILKQQQETIAKLTAENSDLKNKLANINVQSTVIADTVSDGSVSIASSEIISA